MTEKSLMSPLMAKHIKLIKFPIFKGFSSIFSMEFIQVFMLFYAYLLFSAKAVILCLPMIEKQNSSLQQLSFHST